MSILSRLFDSHSKELNRYWRVVEAINELEDEHRRMTDEQIGARTLELRQMVDAGNQIDQLLVPAFALAREAARRAIGLRPFDVQLIGAMVLDQGEIAEMKTGEGKTLVAALALYLNALEAQGVHLVTVNDFLARRDAGWMGPIFRLLGLQVGVIVNQASFVYDPEHDDPSHGDERLRHFRPISRAEAYALDITYGTNNEFGFDYLRDNMVVEVDQCVQRGLHYAIVDEVDSILIDEARTPLIISGQSEESTDKYATFARLASRLSAETDFTVDEKTKSASLTEEGIAKIERWTGIENVYDLDHVEEAHQINQALRANALYQRDVDYVVRDGEVVIVDEFTGRLMPGRRWSDGLHQAIEAKEGVGIQAEMKTMATITFQNYFRLYHKLAGMTGTALTDAEEFHKIYGLEVVVVPTNKPMIRNDQSDLIFKTEPSKFSAVVDEIVELNGQGRPVLVGTVSIDKSERLSRLLDKRGIAHNVLNAKQHEREALIIAEAGHRGAVTIATNMAGRGTDIVLGEGVADLGGLHIIGTERHEARRIDNQLRGRSGRQGDPGSSRFFISLEDDLMRVFGPAADRIGSIMDRLEVEPIEHKWVARSIEQAQSKVEGFNFDARRHVVEYDDVFNAQRAIIYSERRRILEGVDTKQNIIEMLDEIVAKGVDNACPGRHPDAWDIAGLFGYLGQFLPLPPAESFPLETVGRDQQQLKDALSDAAHAAYEAKEAQIGAELMRQIEGRVMLFALDTRWIDYLTSMDHLRDSVGMLSYGQKDPLVEFKGEAFQLFSELTEAIKTDIAANVMRVQVMVEAPPMPQGTVRNVVTNRQDPEPVAMRSAIAGGQSPGEPVTVGAPRTKVGRNELCPCGSGKKYKRCHGR